MSNRPTCSPMLAIPVEEFMRGTFHDKRIAAEAAVTLGWLHAICLLHCFADGWPPDDVVNAAEFTRELAVFLEEHMPPGAMERLRELGPYWRITLQ